MTEAPILTGKLRLKDETGETLNKIGGKISTSFKDIAKVAAGFLARDLVRSLSSAAMETFQLGVEVETLRAGFQSLKGPMLDSAVSVDTLRKAVRGTVSEVDLLRAANNAMALGLPTEDLNELFAAAQTVGAVMGRDTLQAVQDLTTGIGRQSKLILDNLGIIVDTNKAYEEYAETLNKTVSELDAAERKTAFTTAAIEELNKKAKLLEGTTSEGQLSMQRFAASIKDVKTRVGELLSPLAGLTPIFNAMLPAINILIVQALPKLAASLHASTIAAGGLNVALMSLLTNPVVLAVAAFALLATAIITNFMGIRDTIMPVVEWLDSVLRGLAETISDILKGIGKLTGTRRDVITPSPTIPYDVLPEVRGQYGFQGMVTGPTRFIAGEAGPEMVTITPKGAGGGGGNIHFHIGTFIGLNDESARILAEATARYHWEELRRLGARV